MIISSSTFNSWINCGISKAALLGWRDLSLGRVLIDMRFMEARSMRDICLDTLYHVLRYLKGHGHVHLRYHLFYDIEIQH